MLHLFVAHSCLRGHGLYKPDPTLCRNVCIVLTIIIIALSLKKKAKMPMLFPSNKTEQAYLPNHKYSLLAQILIKLECAHYTRIKVMV